ncbi:hypothetical protein [Pseudovibrio sp. Tun.PSC04-5.I4]|uniref:hypothetical protein n=1 Tax=Pseudovibrio sp. Tun.PSC04-5.I4 TaxID=1798213 RepID=UPI000888CF8C|nr:hypothetical protein [Pseudovibrio sp. Tun.PSC04-5.I4]SDR01081.1 hypothetical protein SAMN04515695_2302 [Pseudovibrio sp. Tun.PSC04-5.I4]
MPAGGDHVRCERTPARGLSTHCSRSDTVHTPERMNGKLQVSHKEAAKIFQVDAEALSGEGDLGHIEFT